MTPASELTGAQTICEALIREGVDVMFGIPGGAVMPLYHAMYDYRQQLHHVLCRHEQGAGHAAQGYARATGRVGVCIGTSGPGATNLVTPIADAWMDNTPLVAVTGQVSSTVLGTDAFQETDITGITLPITKHSYLVSAVADLPYVIKEAFYLARTGRPGPVVIDITKDCQQGRAVPNWDVQLRLPGYRIAGRFRSGMNANGSETAPLRDPAHGIAQQIASVVDILAHAERPLLMVGNGVIQSDACAAVLAFAKKTGIPVITTLHGLGAFPQDHPLSLGMAGMHGWVHVNRAIQECDLLVNVGGRFDDRVIGKPSTFAPNATIVHVNIDPAALGKNVRADIGIVGDARTILEMLIAAVPQSHHAAWLSHIRELQARHQHRQAYLDRPRTTALMPHDVYAALKEALRHHGRYRVCTDVGQHQMWAAQLLEWHHPRTHITSGGAGTMGFAVPAAMGVALAYPEETVWVICGDGGFQMTNQEMATIAQEGLRNVKIAIINNGYLGMVRQWQELFEGRRYSGTPLSGPDFSQLATAYGWLGITVEQIADVGPAIQRACATDGCVVIDFRVERHANVFPMVPHGASLGEMLTDASEAQVFDARTGTLLGGPSR